MYGKHNAQSFLESLILVWNAKLGKGCVTVQLGFGQRVVSWLEICSLN